MCIHIVRETRNKTMKILWLWSSSLTGGIKQVSDTLFTNTRLEELVLKMKI